MGTPLEERVAPADRAQLRRALADAGSAERRLDVRLQHDDEQWALGLRVLPSSKQRVLVVSIRRSRIQRFARRFPHGVVGLRDDGRVAFANEHARGLLGDDAVRAGAPFGAGADSELSAIARRLAATSDPVQPTIVERADGTALRVTGLARTADEPGIMFLEDVTAQLRHERVMREFLRNAAHQLRTPLAGITAAIETLQRGAKEHPADRDLFLDHLETHAARLTRITRALLVLARAQGGDGVPLDPVELRPLLDDIAVSIEPRQGVRVETQCERGLAALASPDLLRETLSALADNAVSHTEAGTIRLAAVRRDPDVAVSVTDSGSGIRPEFRRRIFEPFYRVDDDGKGYGLGLAIAAQAVEAMGGEIDVSAGPQGGTSFTVTLRSATVVR